MRCNGLAGRLAKENVMLVSQPFARRAIALTVPIMLVAGCMMGPPASTAQRADTMSPPAPQTCHAEPAQRMVGKPFDEAALRKASGSDQVRTVRPGEAISMLFMNGRLTVYVDAQGTITALSCS